MITYKESIDMLIEDQLKFWSAEAEVENFDDCDYEDAYKAVCAAEERAQYLDDIVNDRTYMVACIYDKDHREVKNDLVEAAKASNKFQVA